MQTDPTPSPRAEASALAGKYLGFRLGAEHYAVAVGKVQEIIGLLPITRVPNTAPHVRGVLNLRGRVVPVVSLRARLGLPPVEDAPHTCVIVVQANRGDCEVVVGAVVDDVVEVMDVSADSIDTCRSFGPAVDRTLVRGLARVGDEVVVLLDADAALAAGDEARG